MRSLKTGLCSAVLLFFMVQGACFSQQEESGESLLSFFVPFSEFEEQEKEISFSLQKSLIGFDKTPITIDVLSSKDLNILPVRNITDALEILPSVSIQQSGESIQPAVPSVFGTQAAYTKVLLDGIELNSQLDGTVDISSYPVNMIRQIEISGTSLSSLWGSGLSGAVYMKSKDPAEQNSFQIDTSCGSFDTFSASVETTLVKGKTRSLFIPQYTKSDGYRRSGESERTHYFFKTFLDVSDFFQIQFLAGYEEARIDGYEQVRFQKRSERDFQRFYSGLRFIHEKAFDVDNLLFSLFFNGVDLDGESRQYRLNSISPDPYNENYSSEQRFSSKTGLSFNGDKHDFSLDAGMDHSNFESNLFKGEKEAESYFFSGLYGYDFSDRLALQMSLRDDHNSDFSGETSYGSGVTFKNVADFDITLYCSRDFNAPPLSYRYIDDRDRMMKSNPDLRAETGKTVRLTISRNFSDIVQIKLSGYRQRLDEGIVLVQDTDEFYYYRNVTSLERKGMEAHLEWDFSKDTILKLGACFNEVENRETGEDVSGLGRMKYTGAFEKQFLEKFSFVFTGYYIWWDMSPQYHSEERNFIFNSRISYEVREGFSLYTAVFNIFDEELYWIDVFPNPERNYQAGFQKKF